MKIRPNIVPRWQSNKSPVYSYIGGAKLAQKLLKRVIILFGEKKNNRLEQVGTTFPLCFLKWFENWNHKSIGMVNWLTWDGDNLIAGLSALSTPPTSPTVISQFFPQIVTRCFPTFPHFLSHWLIGIRCGKRLPTYNNFIALLWKSWLLIRMQVWTTLKVACHVL